MGVTCSDSISHNRVQVLSIPVLLLAYNLLNIPVLLLTYNRYAMCPAGHIA